MELFTTLLELLGAALIVVGLWTQWPWLAVVIAGAALIVIAYQLARPVTASQEAET